MERIKRALPTESEVESGTYYMSAAHRDKSQHDAVTVSRCYWPRPEVAERSLADVRGHREVLGQGQSLLRGHWPMPEAIERLLANTRGC